MKSKFKSSVHINSGSMADIAFLLLIFFMVVTSLKREKSISMKLPPSNEIKATPFNENKVLSISINGNNDILVENDESSIDDAFLKINEELQIILSKSTLAIINLKLHPEADYNAYTQLLSQVKKSINEAKEKRAKFIFGTSYSDLNARQYAELNKQLKIRISESEFKL